MSIPSGQKKSNDWIFLNKQISFLSLVEINQPRYHGNSTHVNQNARINPLVVNLDSCKKRAPKQNWFKSNGKLGIGASLKTVFDHLKTGSNLCIGEHVTWSQKSLHCSLRVAVPTPGGTTGGRNVPFGGRVRLHVGYVHCPYELVSKWSGQLQEEIYEFQIKRTRLKSWCPKSGVSL